MKKKTVIETVIEHCGNVTHVNQGKAVVEEQDFGGAWMVMTPDGEVRMAVTKKDAERRVTAWFKKDLERIVKTTRTEGLVGIGTVEWRML
jgi:hypothetical protein